MENKPAKSSCWIYGSPMHIFDISKNYAMVAKATNPNANGGKCVINIGQIKLCCESALMYQFLMNLIPANNSVSFCLCSSGRQAQGCFLWAYHVDVDGEAHALQSQAQH